MRLRLATLIVLLGLVLIFMPGPALAQPKQAEPFIVNSFSGIYHLSRDSRGLSLLTTEETILADFSGSYYGITREIPASYQGRGVDTKILSVSDAAGNPVPFKTERIKDNLKITTGDPKITLFGLQTIKIRYQTKGVVNLDGKTDQFLLNVNGRGWDQPINRVDAAVFVPANFQANLRGDPSCYLAKDSAKTFDCRISSQTKDSDILINARAEPIAAHQALVLKLDFAADTFTNKKQISNTSLLIIGLTFVFAVAASSYLVLRRS